ncbi:phytoene synthase [Natranaerovirga hydrolytica]|uniref:Phytoene synthase n=1 Tax=Natranaerovirga hydrolytica TaxID=680378 RepID=A0A4R1MYR4_9FIRM|nr:phytoene/squalene synthase family protein [Natranaerovirga hydrolytica]TCK98285.1 phytoene synthase [Natranaerovirga hydrolytica]
MSLKEDYLVCEQIIQSNSKSFYKAFKTLPPKKANGIFAVYAFCRAIDDIVDEQKDMSALDHFKCTFEDFKKGIILDEPIWRALKDTFDTFNLSYEPFDDMILGQYKDTSFSQPNTQKDLEAYCYYVASTVGLMILPLLSRKHTQLKECALHLGKAMQITNILRDVGEDYTNQRMYLPKEVMNGFEYYEEDLKNSVINDDFINLWEYEAQIAETYYSKAMKDFSLFDKDARLSVIAATKFYKEILNAVRKNNYDCFNKRNFVSKSKKYTLLLESYFLNFKLR